MSLAKSTSTSAQPASGRAPVEVRSLRLRCERWGDARLLAETELEPVFVPIGAHVDDRGWSLMNLLVGAVGETGQVNFSMQHPGVVKAWHRHDLQTDFWICLTGHIKVGVYRETDDVAWMAVIGEREPGAIVIPPPLWHGAATVGSTPAGLLYYVTRAYDHDQPDEHRRAWDSVDGFPWATTHG